MNKELKIEILSDYLNESEEETQYLLDNYEVVSEKESSEVLNMYLEPIKEDIEYRLTQSKLEFLYNYIDWDSYFEYTNLLDFEFKEYYFNCEFYYIKKY